MENTDWSALGFDYRKTDYNVRYSFADGKWSDMVVTDDEYIQMHMSASCLHYGIELFEGLKAFRGVDAQRAFRSSLRYGSFALSASGDVRNDGRIGRETGQGSPADRLLFARRSLF